MQYPPGSSTPYHAADLPSSQREPSFDPHPVVKLFTPDAQCSWLLSEVDPQDPDRAFGLCDLGLGTPELGYVSLVELATVRGHLSLPIERDRYLRPKALLSAYADNARLHGKIVT